MINDTQGGLVGADGGVEVEDGIASLKPNDEFAMGLLQGSGGNR